MQKQHEIIHDQQMAPLPLHEVESPPSTYEQLVAVAYDKATFINSESAQLLLDGFDTAGLRLSGVFKSELTQENDARYGNSYAWMTRELAKMIAGRRGDIFEPDDEVWSDEADDYVSAPLSFVGIQKTGDEAADIVIDILQQIEERQSVPPAAWQSDLPVYEARNSIRSGGCKDVETYFAQAGSHSINGLSQVQIQGKEYLHKNHGAATYLNLEPIQFNGVELPPGFVFKQEQEAGFVLLRATGFMFDQSMAENVFGHSITESYEYPAGKPEMDDMFKLFASLRGSVYKNTHDVRSIA